MANGCYKRAINGIQKNMHHFVQNYYELFRNLSKTNTEGCVDRKISSSTDAAHWHHKYYSKNCVLSFKICVPIIVFVFLESNKQSAIILLLKMYLLTSMIY